MKLRQHPIRKLTRQLAKHQAFSSKNIARISLFYFKLLLQEPFRCWEKLQNRQTIQNHRLADDPIFIIGHWRSGTSFMQYLLGQDPQFGYLNKFEAVFPEIFLESEGILKSWAQQIPETFNLSRDAKNMSIDLDWDSPSEVEIALTTMISPASPHWGHIFPQDGAEYFHKYLFLDNASPAERNQWKHDYTYLIKKISLQNKNQQVLVKSPGNTSRIKTLLELYPRARFIFLHRKPYDVFYSSQKLWHTLIDNLALQPISQLQIEQKIITIYKRLLKQYLQQRAAVPDRQLIEIRFDDFVTQPVDTLAEVYNRLNIGGYSKALPHFCRFLNERASDSSGNYDYQKKAIQWINNEWSFAFGEWNYAMRRPNFIHTYRKDKTA